MAKRTVNTGLPEEPPVTQEEGVSAEEAQAIEAANRAERDRILAPYRELHQQQVEQDELIAELLFQLATWGL